MDKRMAASTTLCLIAFLLLLTPPRSFSATVTRYEYDDLNRLMKVTYAHGLSPAVSVDYANTNDPYDGVGNRPHYVVTQTTLEIEIGSQIDENVIVKAGDGAEIGGPIDPAVMKIEVRTSVDGVNWSSWTKRFDRSEHPDKTRWSHTWTAANGNNQVEVKVTDVLGNSTYNTYTIVARTPTPVTVEDKQLLVDGHAFTVRGVTYSPVPIGANPDPLPPAQASAPYGDYFTSEYSALWDRDLPLIRDMGANTIRLLYWNPSADHTAFLDKAYEYGLMVIVTLPLRRSAYSDANGVLASQQAIKNDFVTMVHAVKNHPAVLLWSIGDDLSSPRAYGSQATDLLPFIDELALAAHTQEGASSHPVTASFFFDTAFQANPATVYSAYLQSLEHLDIFGISFYGGPSFGESFFTSYASQTTTKPLLVLGFGIDYGASGVNAQQQEDYVRGVAGENGYLGLWNEISLSANPVDASARICIGGVYRSYSDEWWRDSYVAGCQDTGDGAHGACGYSDARYPDGTSDEEWWGIMAASQNGSSPDTVTQRGVYGALRDKWAVTITLTDGWNMIALPYQPCDARIEHVLKPFEDKIEVVWGFSGQTWYHYRPGQTSSTLSSMEAGKAYWVKITPGDPPNCADCKLVVAGADPLRRLNLAQGWNFVGYNGTLPAPASEFFAGILTSVVSVWRYDNATQHWFFYQPTNPGSTYTRLGPGEGYWAQLSQAQQAFDPPPGFFNTEPVYGSAQAGQAPGEVPEDRPDVETAEGSAEPGVIPTITSNQTGDHLTDDTVAVRGSVTDDAGRGIQKIEISTDGARTFLDLTGQGYSMQGGGSSMQRGESGTSSLEGGGGTGWTFDWTPEASGTYSIVVKVTDGSGNISVDNITVTVDKCANKPVRIAGTTPVYYDTLGDAYAAASNGDVIQARANLLIETLELNNGTNVTIEGGYTCDYSSNTGGVSRLRGTIHTISGKVTLKNFRLTNQ